MKKNKFGVVQYICINIFMGQPIKAVKSVKPNYKPEKEMCWKDEEVKKIVASLLAVLMLLGVAPVTALAGEIELHRINTTQQPAEEPV